MIKNEEIICTTNLYKNADGQRGWLHTEVDPIKTIDEIA